MEILKYLFKKLHEYRTNSSARESIMDMKSNWIIQLIEDEGYYLWKSDDPNNDGYLLALVDENETVVLKDADLGLDFSQDREFSQDDEFDD